MSEEAVPAGALLLAAAIVAVATPIAIAIARRTDFHDHPVGYKGHGAPTPYLGGSALVAGVVIALAVFGEDLDRFGPVLACAAFLWAVGTLDDRLTFPPAPRIAAELAAGVALWAAGAGWGLFDSDVANLVLTSLWVLGVVNAFNLMDNMDGAAGSVALVSSGAIGVLALLGGDTALAAMAFAVTGACAGFLPFNLAGPARIFLGDGGSMPLGFLVASAVMLAPMGEVDGWPALFGAALLVGLPLLDTALVMVSRRRRGAHLWSGGRDHLTHRLRTRLPSARAVAVALALAQAFVCALALAAAEAGSMTLIQVGAACFVAGLAALALLESSAWSPLPTPDWPEPPGWWDPSAEPRIRRDELDPDLQPEPAGTGAGPGRLRSGRVEARGRG